MDQVANSNLKVGVDVDDLERHTEEFTAEVSRERFLVGAGRKESLALTGIYDRHRGLFRPELAAALLRSPDPRSPLLAGLVAFEWLQQRVAPLTDEVANTLLDAMVEWDGEAIPFPALPALIMHEPDQTRRRILERRRLDILAEYAPRLRLRLAWLHEGARALGFTDYAAMCDQLRRLHLDRLTEQVRSLLLRTASGYFHHLERRLAVAAIPRKRAATRDVAHLFVLAEAEDWFPAERMIEVLRRTLADLGIDLDAQDGLELDLVPRPRKSPRAFCAAIRIPEEVKLVLNPRGGQDDYRMLLHEVGHAQHFVHTAADLPFAFRALGDDAVSETYALLFEHLLYEADWLATVLGVSGDPAQWREALRFNRLWLVRRYAAKVLYEQRLHRATEGAADAYASILGDALGVEVPAERWLEDVDEGLQAAIYLRAWILEAQVRRLLRQEFGRRWYVMPAAGAFLRALWREGLRDDVETMAARLGVRPLDVTPLVEDLCGADDV